MKAFFSYLSWLFLGRPIKQKLRAGALYSLRFYITAVSSVRMVSMLAVLGIIGLASIAVGFFLLIGGLLWFAHLNPIAYPWIMVVVGALLTLGGIGGYLFAFREKFWVELSRINEFTNMALTRLPADERLANPAVTGLWTMASQARLREHTRMESELKRSAELEKQSEVLEEVVLTPISNRPVTSSEIETSRTKTRIQGMNPSPQPL